MNITEKFYQFMPKNQFEYSIHISKYNHYIYFEIPKTACSTTKANLQIIEEKTLGIESSSKTIAEVHNKKQSPLSSPSQVGLKNFVKMLDDSNVLKFCFVRNPYTRVLSAYLSKINKKKWGNPYQLEIANILGDTSRKSLTFEEFLIAIKATPSYAMNPHWRIQSDQSFFQLINYDFVGRFECFSQDLQKVLSLIASNINYQDAMVDIRENHPTNFTDANSKLRKFYNQKTTDLVCEIYEEDFKNFNYTMNLIVDN